MKSRTLENRERYNRAAAFYEWFVRSGSLGQFHRFYRAVADAIEANPGALAVDMGCGPGTLTPYLLPKVGPTGEVVGTDVSDRMIERARSLCSDYGWPNARFERADARKFTPERPPGIVVFCLSLSTMPDAGRCFSRACSWLHSGGQLVVLDSFPDSGRRLAALVVRLKAPLVGADASAVSLTELASSLDSVRMRHLQGGVYTLLSGRRPGGRGAAIQHRTAAAEH